MNDDEVTMKMRSFRAGTEWDEAKAKAKAEGTELARVLRRALREYVRNKTT